MLIIPNDFINSDAKRGSGWLQLPGQKSLYKKIESSISMDSGGRARFFVTSSCTTPPLRPPLPDVQILKGRGSICWVAFCALTSVTVYRTSRI